MALKYPCTDCDVRKAYQYTMARMFDVLFFGEACPKRCEAYDAWCKECDEDDRIADGVGQAFNPD